MVYWSAMIPLHIRFLSLTFKHFLYQVLRAWLIYYSAHQSALYLFHSRFAGWHAPAWSGAYLQPGHTTWSKPPPCSLRDKGLTPAPRPSLCPIYLSCDLQGALGCYCPLQQRTTHSWALASAPLTRGARSAGSTSSTSGATSVICKQDSLLLCILCSTPLQVACSIGFPLYAVCSLYVVQVLEQ